MMKTVSIIIIAALAGWAALFLTSSAVLVHGSAPALEQGDGHRSFKCQFFTGTGVVVRTYWYYDNGMMGRDTCPRLISLT